MVRFVVVMALAMLAALAVAQQQGACNNDNDMPIVGDHDQMHAATKHCGRSCQGRASCTAHCLADTLHISQECAACFGDEVSCTALHCAAPCIVSSDSKSCRACSERHCGEAVRNCTGLGGDGPDDGVSVVKFAERLTADVLDLLCSFK